MRINTLSFMIVLSSAATTAIAEQQDRNAPGFSLEEIIVTAQKRETTLQDTPLAITALGAEEIAKKGIDSVAELQNYVPGLRFGQTQNGGSLNIRGIGFENVFLGGDGGVAYHVNGVYIARPEAVGNSFFDIERIEVLLGAQGTLYGRNATGGAVNVLQKKPTEQVEGFFSAEVGNYDAVTTEGAISGSLGSNKVLGRLSMKTLRHDGYTDNLVAGGTDTDDADSIAVRGQLQFYPVEYLSVLLAADYYRSDAASIASNKLEGNPLGTLIPTQIDDGVDTIAPLGERKVYVDSPTFAEKDSDSVTLTVEYQLSEVDFISISDYRESRHDSLLDEDGVRMPIEQQIFYFNNADQFSQEFRLSSANDSGFKWLAGLYYFREEATQRLNVDVGPYSAAAADSTVLLAGLGGIPLLVDLGGTLETESYAVFGQLDWELGDWALTFGLRYSYDERDVSGEFNTFAVGTFDNPTPPRNENFDEVTGKIGIHYNLNEDTLLYASVAQGFKSGSFNVGAVTEPFEPETVLDYEFGIKSTFWDGRAQANLSAFYYDYQDLQLQQVVGFVSTLTIAGKATVYGMEVDSNFLITESFKIRLGGTYLNAEFDEFSNTDEATPIDPVTFTVPLQDLSGNTLPNSPEFTFIGAAQYTTEINDTALLTFDITYYWQDDLFFDSFNREEVGQEAVGRVDATIGLSLANGRWEIEAFGKNLTDEYVKESSFVVSRVLGAATKNSLAPPRTYGLRARYTF